MDDSSQKGLSVEELPFEDALKKLESIVNEIENGSLSLEDSLKFFDEGKKLSDLCSRKLSAFEKKIEVLVRESEEGGKWRKLDAEKEA